VKREREREREITAGGKERRKFNTTRIHPIHLWTLLTTYQEQKSDIDVRIVRDHVRFGVMAGMTVASEGKQAGGGGRGRRAVAGERTSTLTFIQITSRELERTGLTHALTHASTQAYRWFHHELEAPFSVPITN
jgi:hypothetical protein